MKRRGFLGLIGGAAVAGPAAAKNALSVAAPTMGGNLGAGGLAVGMFADANQASSGLGHAINQVDRIAQIRRWISGDEEPEEDFYDVARVRQAFAEQHVNSLQSMSGAAKIRVMRREMTKHERDKQKKYWWNELLRIERNSA